MRTFITPNHRGAMITAIMQGRTPEEFIAQIREADYEGADGICIDLANLEPQFRTKDVFARLLSTAPHMPFMFYFYRKDPSGQCKTDEERQEILLQAAEAGAHIIDVIGDLYNPSPRENTHDEEAIKKQMALIDKIHSLGSQVVMSSHPCEVMSSDEVLQQLRDFEKRGADVVKCVATANTVEELMAALSTTVRLHRELNKPFIHLINGKAMRLHRFLGVEMGCDIVFAVARYDMRVPFTQPTVRAMREVRDALRFDIDDIL